MAPKHERLFGFAVCLHLPHFVYTRAFSLFRKTYTVGTFEGYAYLRSKLQKLDMVIAQVVGYGLAGFAGTADQRTLSSHRVRGIIIMTPLRALMVAFCHHLRLTTSCFFCFGLPLGMGWDCIQLPA